MCPTANKKVDRQVIGDYVCLEKLGAGGQATTWLAEPAAGGERLLLKVFHVEVAEDWKAVELFERAASVLESLDHPNIPAYHDHFEVESDGVVQLCLAREFVAGESLQDRIDAAGSRSESEVVDLAIELLGVLDYLHTQQPPIVHRDIKPSNIMLGEDGRPYLVDFGAVQAEVLGEKGGSTIIGTAGYVAPEQLMGKARPSSDIYALGITLVHLLTHTPPSELPTDGFDLAFDDRLESSEWLEHVLRRMTRADVDERFDSAEDVLEALRQRGQTGALVASGTDRELTVPSGSHLEAVHENGEWVVRSPSKVLYWDSDPSARLSKVFAYGLLMVPIALAVALTTATTLLQLGLGGLSWSVGGLAALGVCYAFWRMRRRLAVRFGREALEIQQPPFRARPARDENDGRPGHRPRRSNVEVRWEALEGASVIREKQMGGTADVWKLQIRCREAIIRGPSPDSRRDWVRESLRVELNLTHGEYIWLARMIDEAARRARPGGPRLSSTP